MINERIIMGLEAVPPQARGGGVLTIGNFDGVHVGHQQILKAAKRLARAAGQASVAVTLEPPPEFVLRPGDARQRILPPRRKFELLAEHVDYVVVLKSEPLLLGMAPQEFIEAVIVKHFAPVHMVEGENFFFGLARSGNVNTLREFGQRCGFDVEIVKPIHMNLARGQTRVSSTLIRYLVGEGNVADAGRCLTRPFCLYGRIVPGEGRGRQLDFPTINIEPLEQITPADGVYAGQARIDSRSFGAAISVGAKPTFGAADRTIEAYLIDADGDYYGRPAELSFLKRLRDQEKFPTADALKAQIAKDVESVRKVCC